MLSYSVRCLLVFMTTVSMLDGSTFFDVEKPRKNCALTRVKQMLAADCHRLDLTHIPADLDAAIEILEISYNRIRELPCDAFSSYPNLKLLYLGDNLITTLEEGVFRELTKLEVLDLSLNALQTVPVDVASLPNMRKLYLDKNQLGQNGFKVLEETKITFPLQYLSVAYSGLSSLPPLSSFPELTFLNVSGNNIRTILPEQLAPACHLEKLDLNNNKQLFEDNECQCQILEEYLKEKKVVLTPPFQLNCNTKVEELSESECGNNTAVSPETQHIYNNCKQQKLTYIHQLQVRKTWLIAVVSVTAVIVAVLVVLFYLRRRRNKRLERIRKAEELRNNNLNRPGNPDEQRSNLLEDRGFNITNIQNM